MKNLVSSKCKGGEGTGGVSSILAVYSRDCGISAMGR